MRIMESIWRAKITQARLDHLHLNKHVNNGWYAQGCELQTTASVTIYSCHGCEYELFIASAQLIPSEKKQNIR